MHYLSGIIVGLHTDSLEPCLFAGGLKPGVPCLILVYVDDLLIAAPKGEDIDRVISTIGKHVEFPLPGGAWEVELVCSNKTRFPRLDWNACHPAGEAD